MNETILEEKIVKNPLPVFACFIFWILAGPLISPPHASSQDNSIEKPAGQPTQLTLKMATMCEEIKEYAPHHSGVAFSISAGRVSCFTMFDPVPEKTIIYHRWYHKDKPSTRKRLTLKPPRWGTFSTIQLRHTDKGPWRVEITDHKNRLFQTLRFSVTD